MKHFLYNIRWQYPLIGFLTLLLSFVILQGTNFSLSLLDLSTLLLTWALLAIILIDIKELIIPNIITFPFMGLGVFFNCFNFYQSFYNALLGLILGYIFLGSVYYIYKFISGKEGLGFGDVKLLAMLGAWLGWKILPFIVLCASILGATVGIILMILGRANRNTPLPFGAFLSFAGIIALLIVEDIC